MSFKRVALIIWACTILAWGAVGVQEAGATGQQQVTICHAAGLEGTTQYVTLTIAYPAVYGPAGHFFENGTPRAGHEQDYLGACVTEPPPPPTCEEDPTQEGCEEPPPPTCETDPTLCEPEPPTECDTGMHEEDGECVPDKPKPPVTKCYEDMPCWDCKTMGNLKCGPGGIDKKPLGPHVRTSGQLPYTGPVPFWVYVLVAAGFLGGGVALHKLADRREAAAKENEQDYGWEEDDYGDW